MSKPLISFLMSYRGRIETDESLKALFDSLVKYYTPDSIEVIVRIDSDDLYGKEKIKAIRDSLLNYTIKIEIYNRWEGRWSINYDYEYMFTRKNPYSKFVGFITDDVVFSRNIIDDLIKSKDTLLIGDFKSDNTKEKFDLVEDYKKNNWLTSDYICAYPIVSSKLVEIMGNFGWQVNIDSTFALVNMMMYKQYGIIISQHIPEFIIRNNVDRSEFYGHLLNKEWIMNDEQIAKDDYFFQLMNQTVKNIYLNIKNG